MRILDSLRTFGKGKAIREEVRESYCAHREYAHNGNGDGFDRRHASGLYGALRDYYRKAELERSEFELWAELGPFLGVARENSVEALGEYIVYKTNRHAARTEWLSDVLSEAAQSTGEHVRLIARGIRDGFDWVALLDQQAAREVARMLRAMDERPGKVIACENIGCGGSIRIPAGRHGHIRCRHCGWIFRV